MHDSAKYLIHADIEASGVVERSDVVGAVFGQTEGLLGDELDIRGLQESGRLGRIEVEVDSEGGQSFGTITIASGLDRVETAILAAALESIERVGPCRADIEVTELEDARSAKRREIVQRATDLLAEFEETTLTSEDIVEEVRTAVRVEDITEFHGMPAGPRVEDSDAIVVVEGRSDVLALLEFGVKNAIAVEGTDVPDPVADLTRDRTVTAFLDGDRGGDLILKELTQVGDIDYVALAPPDRSVEDLSRTEALSALREKVPFEAVDETPDHPTSDGPTDHEVATDGAVDGGRAAVTGDTGESASDSVDTPDAPDTSDAPDAPDTTDAPDAPDTTDAPDRDEDSETTEERDPQTLAGHVEAVVGGETGLARALDADWERVDERPADETFDMLESLSDPPAALVVDGTLPQRTLDVAAQRGVGQVVCAREGEYVKQPTDVRVRTAAEL
jgi:DNA primase